MYINEHMMDVYINDHLTMKLVCLPQHLTELVLGRLLTEQIITSSEDVDHIYICEYGKRAKVYLKNSARNTQSSSDAFVEVTPTCCTGNHILYIQRAAVTYTDFLETRMDLSYGGCLCGWFSSPWHYLCHT